MAESIATLDADLRAALDELRATIQRHFPTSTFRVSRGEDDPTIVQLVATVDVDDTDRVLDVVIDRLLDQQAADLPIFVVTERPTARTAALRAASSAPGGHAVVAPRG